MFPKPLVVKPAPPVQPYWAARTTEQALAVSAWVAQAEGARDQAVKLMRAAADGEDGSVKHVAMENRLSPMRELLGELLLQGGRPAAALIEFEASLKETPNRYRGLAGAGRAAEAAGDGDKAAGYYEKLVALSSHADTARPELVHAKAFLSALTPIRTSGRCGRLRLPSSRGRRR